MPSLPKRVLYGSIGLMAILAGVSALDIVTGMVFAEQRLMDIFFLVGAGLVIYLAVDALKEQK